MWYFCCGMRVCLHKHTQPQTHVCETEKQIISDVCDMAVNKSGLHLF